MTTTTTTKKTTPTSEPQAPRQLTEAEKEALFEKVRPKEVDAFDMDLADEAAPHIDFQFFGTFEGKKIKFPGELIKVRDEEGNDTGRRRWEGLRYFDFDRGSNTQRMAWTILSHMEPGVPDPNPERVDENGERLLVVPPESQRVVDTPFNQRALYLAAYFHHLGRTKPFDENDKGMQARSAAMAKAIFEYHRGERRLEDGRSVEWASQEGLEELVISLIENYHKPTTLLEEIMHDSVLFQDARYKPNTRSANERLAKNWRKFVTTTGKSEGFQKQYMRLFGWKIPKPKTKG